MQISAVALSPSAPSSPPGVQLSVTLAPGPGARQWFSLPDSTWAMVLAGTHVLTSTVVSSEGATASHHVILGSAPKDLHLANATVTFEVARSAHADGTYDISVQADQVTHTDDIVGGMHALVRVGDGSLCMCVSMTCVRNVFDRFARVHQVALFVTFTTLAQGRFSDNAFMLAPNAPKVVRFVPFAGFSPDELRNSLRVEHLYQRL